jgi:hypothetical protein
MNRVQDTARWAALARAQENTAFYDPWAPYFAGGDSAQSMLLRTGGSWAAVTRTYIFDRLVEQAVADGADCIVNLGAGFDMRPYRMLLPETLVWCDVDHEDLLKEKAFQLNLGLAQPKCAYYLHPVDLTNSGSLRRQFREITKGHKRIFVMSEGLLVYLPGIFPLMVAVHILATPGVFRWATDMMSPEALERVQEAAGSDLQGTAKMVWGGTPHVFDAYGWRPKQILPVVSNAALINRLPSPPPPPGHWAGVVVLEPK